MQATIQYSKLVVGSASAPKGAGTFNRYKFFGPYKSMESYILAVT